ncbi:unnamed protein product [Effrenium voratum]|nr:unnamed protein product [Effrenium voratum]
MAHDAFGFGWLLASQVSEQLRAREREVVVVPHTSDYRSLARRLVQEEHVVEVGSSLGKCSEILCARAASLLAVDVSLEQLATSRAAVPGATFEFLDLFEEAPRLAAMDAARDAKASVAFLDIGGDRRCGQVLCGIRLLQQSLPALRLIVVKSEEVYSAMAQLTGSSGLGDGCVLPEPKKLLDLDDADGGAARGSAARRARRMAALAESRAMAAAQPGRWFPRRAIEAALLGTCEQGFCLSPEPEAGSCIFLHPEQQPLFRAEAVVCLFDEVAHGERLVSRFGTHAVPIFWGHGGSYRVDRILPAEHEHYQAPVLLEHLRQVRARSRRHARARPVVLLQLAEAEPPMGRLGAPEEPCHPAECSEHEWQTEIRRRVADECQRGKDEGLTPDAARGANLKDRFPWVEQKGNVT